MPVALVVEDKAEFSAFVVSAFERVGFDALTIDNIIDAVEIINQSTDIEILLINLARKREGIEFAQVVSARWSAIKLILLSAQFDSLSTLPPIVFVTKPTNPAVLTALIEHVAHASANNWYRRGIAHGSRDGAQYEGGGVDGRRKARQGEPTA